jgi:hypothetical protein
MLIVKVKQYLENNGKTVSELENNIILRNDLTTPPDGKVKVDNDYIDTWNVDGVDAPTQSEIDAL